MKLLDEYKGQKVTIKAVNGYITFDTAKAPETDYPTYHALGFDFCFEPQEPTYREPIYYRAVIGIEEAEKLGLLVESTKGNKRRNGKKAKTESKKA